MSADRRKLSLKIQSERLTSEANPRQIERVIPGCKFNISIIYNINSDAQLNGMQIEEDLKAIKNGLKLLEYDYIGGHGTRMEKLNLIMLK